MFSYSAALRSPPPAEPVQTTVPAFSLDDYPAPEFSYTASEILAVYKDTYELPEDTDIIPEIFVLDESLSPITNTPLSTEEEKVHHLFSL
jgi:hypothetical protein